MGTTRHPHWQRKARVIQINRQKAYRAQGCRCHYCGVLMPEPKRIKQFCQEHQIDLADAQRIQLTAEHLVPVSEGGTNSRSNIVAACWYCNHTRHHGAPVGLDHQAYAQWVKQQQLLGQWHPDQYKALLAVNCPPDGPTHMLPSTQRGMHTQTEGGEIGRGKPPPVFFCEQTEMFK